MFDHVGLTIRDPKTRAFYERALAPLGVTVQMEYGGWAGLGRDGKPSFWIGTGAPSYFGPGHEAAKSPLHFAFSAKSRAEVDAFHAAALAAGGRDHGGPGLRPEYHERYYGAFVIDPDGNNDEAVFHGG